MSTLYGPFTPTAAGSFSLDIGQASSTQGFSVLNESGYLLTVTIGSQQMPAPAWTNYYFDVTHLSNFNGSVSFMVTNISSQNSPPSNAVIVTSYGPGERVNVQQFGALNRQTNIGNTVNILGANQIANDNSATLVQVVEATLLGNSASNMILNNDGTYTHAVTAVSTANAGTEVLTNGGAGQALLKLTNVMLEILNAHNNGAIQIDVADVGFGTIRWFPTGTKPQVTWNSNMATGLAMDVHREAYNGFSAIPLFTVDTSGNTEVYGTLQVGTATTAIAAISALGATNFSAGANVYQTFTHNLGQKPKVVAITGLQTTATWYWRDTTSTTTTVDITCTAASGFFSAVLMA